MKCPRCGEEMTGGICDNCGFPLTKMRKKSNNVKSCQARSQRASEPLGKRFIKELVK